MYACVWMNGWSDQKWYTKWDTPPPQLNPAEQLESEWFVEIKSHVWVGRESLHHNGESKIDTWGTYQKRTIPGQKEDGLQIPLKSMGWSESTLEDLTWNCRVGLLLLCGLTDNYTHIPRVSGPSSPEIPSGKLVIASRLANNTQFHPGLWKTRGREAYSSDFCYLPELLSFIPLTKIRF